MTIEPTGARMRPCITRIAEGSLLSAEPALCSNFGCLVNLLSRVAIVTDAGRDSGGYALHKSKFPCIRRELTQGVICRRA